MAIAMAKVAIALKMCWAKFIYLGFIQCKTRIYSFNTAQLLHVICIVVVIMHARILLHSVI